MKLPSFGGTLIAGMLCLVLLAPPGVPAGYSQEPPADGPAGEKKEAPEEAKRSGRSKNVNIDLQMVYGQYNNMLSTINLSQEQQDLVYLLSSYFKRSNDFGYKNVTFENTSFYENRIGFTGNLNASDAWKAMLDLEVDNDSRGMYTNPVYSREEKDKARISLKNIRKFGTSFEGYFTLGGAEYVHRLQAVTAADNERSKMDQASAEAGGEWIWSAANRIRFSSAFFYNKYTFENAPRDTYVNGEIVDDFNLTRNIGINVGGNLDWNKDGGYLLSPIAGFSLKGYRYVSMSMLYRYDLVPFRPEEFYYQLKYINPTYDLPPGRVHHGEVKGDLRVGGALILKAAFMVEKNDNFYNYRTVTGNVLGAETLSVVQYDAKGDANLLMFDNLLEMNLGYGYARFRADKNITYRPAHILSGSLKYNGALWKFEWTNKIMGRVHPDPDSPRRLDRAVIGYFGVQIKVLDSFYGYFRIENLYNNEYYLREGYPEPGITLLFGIRILI